MPWSPEPISPLAIPTVAAIGEPLKPVVKKRHLLTMPPGEGRVGTGGRLHWGGPSRPSKGAANPTTPLYLLDCGRATLGACEIAPKWGCNLRAHDSRGERGSPEVGTQFEATRPSEHAR